MVIDCLPADDDNRIALKPLPDVSDCQRDYINACYVDVRELASLLTRRCLLFSFSYSKHHS